MPTADQQRPYGPHRSECSAPQQECAGSGPAPARGGLPPCMSACPCSCKLTQPGATARVKVAALPAHARPCAGATRPRFHACPQGRRRRTARGQGVTSSSQRRPAGMPAAIRIARRHPGSRSGCALRPGARADPYRCGRQDTGRYQHQAPACRPEPTIQRGKAHRRPAGRERRRVHTGSGTQSREDARSGPLAVGVRVPLWRW